MNYVTDILNDYGFIRIHGPDSSKFLQGQLTCDVKQITAQHSSLGAHCDPKGRMIALFRLFDWQKDYYMLLPQSILPTTLASLQKYARFAKTELIDISAQLACFGCYGESLDAIFGEFLAPIPTSVDQVVIKSTFLMIHILSPKSASSSLSRILIIGEQADILTMQKKLLNNASKVGTELWHLLDIQAQVAQLYPQTSGQLTPHEINLPALNGVSFSKGCYTGQEVIARMQHLGKLKKHMYLVELSTSQTPTPGCPIIQQPTAQTVGLLVDFATVSDHCFIALAIIQDNALDDNELCLADNDSSKIVII